MSFSAQASQANYFLLPSDELEKSKLQTNKSNKTPKKSNYGSLRQDAQTQQTAKVFLVNYPHRLAPGETLQGISLKYGVPVRKKSEFELNFFVVFIQNLHYETDWNNQTRQSTVEQWSSIHKGRADRAYRPR